MKIAALTITIVAPVGRFKIKENIIPKKTEKIENKIDIINVALKPGFSCKALTVGKMIILETSIVPTTLIPIDIVIAVRIAIIVFINFVFKPMTRAKSSS